MVRTKVFVGNLSFKTREAELAQQFETVAKVVGVNIITRGPRSLGYGFVELESEEDAKKAVAAMDKKEIDGRPINVDIAKARPEGADRPAAAEGAEGSPKPSQPRPRRGSNNRGKGAAKPATGSPNPAAPAGENAEGQAPPRRPRTRQPRKDSASGDAQQGADGASPAQPKQPRAPRPKREGAATGSPKPEGAKQPRAPRPPRDPQNDTRIPSENSLFVANLPFSVTSESFGKLLTDKGLKFKRAHVVVKRNLKSKGFGFVEFESQEDQKKALDSLTGHKIEDRELAPKIALVDPKKDAAAEKTPQSPAPTPAAETKTA